jgi:cytochrome c-type biogenesis protein
MEGSDLTLLVAFVAGLLSFLSPCVLPLVPAYIGQLTVVAVVGRANAVPSRWLAVRHAVAFVVGFGAVFTILGITATFVGGPIADYLPFLRIPALDRTWRPLEAGAAGALAEQTGTVAFATPGAEGGPGVGERLGGRLVGGQGGIFASFGLGVVFAVGWTPCIGIILGGILTVAASSTTTLQGALLLVAYTLGLGVPFILLGLVYDRAPALVRPLVRHGQAVSFVGGILVALIGVFMLMDWLTWFSRLAPGI